MPDDQKNIKISVIVPVYNVEKYLEQCIHSLIDQTMAGIEIICIDDGSTDNSGRILDNLAKKHDGLIVKHYSNRGYGATINSGIRLACGQYIGIVESDDFVEKDMYAKLYNEALIHDADIVKCNFNAYYSDTGERIMNEDLKQIPYHQVFSDIPEMFVIPVAVWAGIYRREYLKLNNIYMLPTPGASFQDTGFAFKVMVCRPRLVTIPDSLVNYRVDNAESSVKDNSKIFNICDELHSIREFIETNNRMELMGVYERAKCLRYRWNLDRLDTNAKEKFITVMHDEFVQDEAEGFLIRECWPEWEWDYVQRLIHKYDEFQSEVLI